MRDSKIIPTSVEEMLLSNEALLVKLRVAQLVKKSFPPFYGTKTFIAMFTKSHHWPVSRVR
jgi:hypothetical protein